MGALIVHPGALGDVLLALPAIRAVRAASRGHVVLSARGDIGRLLQECGEVDAVIPVEGRGLTELFAGGGWTSIERCETAVCWLRESEALQETLIGHGVRRIIIQSPFADRLTGHQSDRFLGTVRSIAPAPASAFDPVAIPQAWRTARHETVIIHPGSGSRDKYVDASTWAAIVDWCRESGTEPCLLEGPADAGIVAEILTRVPDLSVIRDVDLQTVAGVLADVVLYLGIDSGISHLAACVGTRSVVMFTTTDPHRWAPRGRHVTVLRCEQVVHPGLRGLFSPAFPG